MAVHFHPQPKPRPRALQKLDRRKALEARDERESAKVKVRSAGRCELKELPPTGRQWSRCKRRALHVHHCLGGFGVRGRGESALAENKLHLCDWCHSDIHQHVLVHDGEMFRRVR